MSSKSVKMSRTDTTIRSWTAKPILSSEFTEPPVLQEVYVGLMKQRKNTLTAIQSISTILPGFHHLRRCSNGRLLLASLCSDESSSTNDRDSTLSEDKLKSQLKEKGFDLSLLEDKFYVTKVPAKAPRTKSQASEASKVWPVNFHPDVAIESIIDGSVFSEENLRAIGGIMSLVIEAARLEAIGDESCTGAAAVVDPEDGRILVVSAARIDRHPMWHAAMLAVDLVAKLHGGGAWRLDDEERDEAAKRRANDVGDVEEKQRADSREDVDESENQRTRLRRIKRRYEEDTPLCYPKSLSALAFPPQTSLETQVPRKGRRNNGAKSATAQEEAQGGDVPCANKCGPYLCTGYWVFLLAEPCPLCAMALLHSRVARIFYGATNPRVGVLGSRAVLHTTPGLNHRYRVWSGILEQECRRTVEEIEARRCSA
ncbi:probable inactive tRNA-specific adenosine deaminase-like protein 3 [Odontomachus brunneus]|uniref:probable inactive tRNA-specific adenosine deaminase-like protein 3 n=1 Tax=Odontomachus brunneus TaxID=486640 RepID=UPI0013F2132B|nr:probable inactive tRNA-specific adenosine deaminase-like protein 3 [Odontomachus brunneus]